ncbi:hypothetical protein A2U01_0065676, partial [Trifolium medium]|nr:hypothetical protein [Trifolium medium]
GQLRWGTCGRGRRVRSARVEMVVAVFGVAPSTKLNLDNSGRLLSVVCGVDRCRSKMNLRQWIGRRYNGLEFGY